MCIGSGGRAGRIGLQPIPAIGGATAPEALMTVHSSTAPQRSVVRLDAKSDLLFGAAITAAVLISGILTMTASPSVPLEFRLIAALIFVIGCLPVCGYLRNPRSAPIPMLALFSGYYVFAFSLPAFADPDLRQVHWFDTVSSAALVGALIAMCSQSAGFLFGRRCFRSSIRPFHLPKVPNPAGFKIALWCLVLLKCSLLLVPSLNQVSTIKQFAYFGSMGSYGLLFRLWRTGRLSKVETVILFGLVLPLEILMRMATGLLAEIVLPFSFFCLVVWATERTVYWKTCLLATFAIAILNGVKYEYRAQTWMNGDPQETVTVGGALSGAKRLAALGFTRYASSGESAWNSHLLERAAQIGFLSHVMEQTPASVPYLWGSSYASLLVKPVPRLLWPDKPIEDAGYWFSARYGMRSAGDYTTSFNVPWVVEAYANFGMAGLTVGMLLIGFVMGTLDTFLNSHRMSETDLIFGISLIYATALQESNFSLVIGSILPAALALYIYFSLWSGSIIPRLRRMYAPR